MEDQGAAARGARPDAGAVAYVALGSNLGDRRAAFEEAARRLASEPDVRVTAASRVYETAPVGPPGQAAYLNAVLEIETRLPARALLGRLLAIERAAGRRRGGERWGPRELDLDLLLYGERRIEEPGLVVPHPRLHERPFVLEPLCDLAPDACHPVSGEPLRGLAARVRDPSAVRVWSEPVALLPPTGD